MADRQTILVVEDAEDWQRILKETLEDEGYEVDIISDYRDSRQALDENDYALVVVDLELDPALPTWEGERLLEHIKQHRPGTRCVVVTGVGDEETARKAFKIYHVADYFAKEGFEIPAFVRAVREALRQGQDEASGPVSEESALQQRYLTQLRQILTERFDEGELRTLCFDLDVDYDSLPGEGKGDKARELVAFLERRDRISELVDTGRQLRPDDRWEEMP